MTDPAAFKWFPFLAVGWIALALAVSIAFRKRRGKPIFPKAPLDALFSERGCSGSSFDTPWARIGGAQNCLLVALAPQKLTIIPIFPFNLIFLPEIYGLDHSLDISAIQEVVDRKGILGRRLMITYADPKTRRVELRLRHHDAFVGSLQKLGIRVATVSPPRHPARERHCHRVGEHRPGIGAGGHRLFRRADAVERLGEHRR